MTSLRWCVIGGAGFIGSHFVDELLTSSEIEKVTIYDNFSSGREWHYEQHARDYRLKVLRGDAADLPALESAIAGHDVVIHLASNPDIARAAREPQVDFDQGTLLTNNVVEAMRCAEVPRLLYASGSGVYGDLGEHEAREDHGPLVPVSTYGASKLAGEALIASYCAMFGMTACAFRFANVVGPRQTHGVGYDFVRRLIAEPGRLRVLGDGMQSKSYIHVSDVVAAVLCAHEKAVGPFNVFNVATGDALTVSEIAALGAETLEIDMPELEFTGGTRGWKGDVPVVRLNTERMRALGWSCGRSSREAMIAAMGGMIAEERVCCG